MSDPINNRYNVVTTGRGLLPKGRIVGYIESDNPHNAEEQLIASRQILPCFRGHFDFIEDVPTRKDGM